MHWCYHFQCGKFDFSQTFGAFILLIFFCVRFPFDTKNLIGYSFAGILEYVVPLNIDLNIMCMINFAIAMGSMLISLAEDIKRSMDTLNASVRANECKWKILHRFSGFVQFHSTVIQLSEFKWSFLLCICFKFPFLL